MNATERQQMAALPVALPAQERVNPAEGSARVERALIACGVNRRIRTDDELLLAYRELRERTGLHPADLWFVVQGCANA